MIARSTVPRQPLGRTGLEVSILGFGAAPLGDLYKKLDDAIAIAAVERALALGINLIDASPLYGHGLAEHRCGTAIRRVPRDQVVISTKVGRWMDPFRARGGESRYVGGQPPAIAASAGARDPRLDQIAFSRGRFLVDVAGQSRLVLPAWPEVARVIEDCRG